MERKLTVERSKLRVGLRIGFEQCLHEPETYIEMRDCSNLLRIMESFKVNPGSS